MTAFKNNKKALDALVNGNIAFAQHAFFENAKKNPSHQTFNNLGYYLIENGLLCKNGRFRNAYKLGLKYLFRAAQLEDSSVNLCAIAQALDYELRYAEDSRAKAIYEESATCLEKALKAEHRFETEYNLLRIKALQNPRNLLILDRIRSLINDFESAEVIKLYFELLIANSLFDEVIECIEKYQDYFDELDLLMIYSRLEMYEKGYTLCKIISDLFAPDKYIASAIVECCVNTNHIEEAREYAKKMIETERGFDNPNETWFDLVLNDLDASSCARKAVIREYKCIPPFLHVCCYYGCDSHSTEW